VRSLLRAAQAEHQRQALSTAGLLVAANEPPGPCPVCGGRMSVQKTLGRSGVTIEHGPFQVRETVHACIAGCRWPSGERVTRRPGLLARLIPPHSVVGYDVLVEVGLLRFVHQRQREEIRASLLQEHGVRLSTGEVSALTRRFLRYLQALHHARAEKLRAALAADGGWPLHIDATGEDGRGTLLVAFSGWRHWVLGAWKISTERADAIAPRLREVIRDFGAPSAIVRDLGKAMTEAADELVTGRRQPIPVLACHLHFLADIGKDLIEPGHDRLRGLIRRFKVRVGLRRVARDLGRALGPNIAEGRQAVQRWQTQTDDGHVLPKGTAGLATVRALAQWVLDFPKDASDQGFPFDRPYLDLYDRCLTALRATDAFLRRPPRDTKCRRALVRLHKVLAPVVSQLPFAQVAKTVRARATLFGELRDALRLLPKPAKRNPPSRLAPADPAAQVAELRDIKTAVAKLTASLRKRRPKRGPAQDARQAIDVVLAHIDRHGPSLWGHLIRLPKRAGGGIRVVDRTNNILESFFRTVKHGERRRSGRKVLTQDLEQLPPGAALAMNLTADDYVRIVCGSLDQLPRAFAELDAHKETSLAGTNAANTSDTILETDVASASLPTADRRLIRAAEMEIRIMAAAKSRAPRIVATATPRSPRATAL
jgi:hypothetical protein